MTDKTANTSSDLNGRLEALVDEAVAEIRATSPTERELDEAGAKVWQSIQEASNAPDAPAQAERIEAYDDFVSLLPAYLDGSLPASRRLLLEDYARESVPFRRALNAAKRGESLPGAAKGAAVLQQQAPANGKKSPQFWAMAAVLVAALGMVPFLMWQFGSPSGPTATVAVTDGSLFRVGDISYEPLELGVALGEKETVRTGHSSGAVLKLRDGSLVEMKERSEVSIRENRRGTTVDLERGSVIVEAAPQRDRRLYVSTEDFQVAVKGTVFSVNRGMKGSRVSVIEGEVVVDDGQTTSVLLPGNQLATPARLGRTSVRREIAWSRDLDRHLAILKEFVELGQEIDRSVARPGLRYQSELLKLAPAETVVAASMPNLGETFAETYKVIEERVAQSDLLSDWWNRTGPGVDGELAMSEFVSMMTGLGDALGEEIIVTGQLDASTSSDPIGGFAVIASLRDEQAFKALIQQKIVDRFDGKAQEHLVWLEELPGPTAAQTKSEQVFVWTDDQLLVISEDPRKISQIVNTHQLGGDSEFASGDFFSDLGELYREGAGLFVGADLGRIMQRDRLASQQSSDFELMERTGFTDARRLMFEQKRSGDRTTHRAVLSFDEGRRGIASWLAAPAPMGSLDFISPDAKLVTATVFKDPKALLADIDGMFGSLNESFSGEVEGFESRYGLSLRDDIAGALGGEIAFAIDGPMLPKPAWKLVVEVYDAARFEWAMEQALLEVNRVRAEDGKEPVEIVTENVRGQLFFSMSGDLMDLHYTFTGGYLVAGPSRALVDRALRQRDSGQSILEAPGFAALLPNDGRQNFSAIAYQDFGGLLGPVLDRMGGDALSERQRQLVDEIKGSQAPVLAYAYAESDRIIMAAESNQDLFSTGLMALLGMEAAAFSEVSAEAAPLVEAATSGVPTV